MVTGFPWSITHAHLAGLTFVNKRVNIWCFDAANKILGINKQCTSKIAKVCDMAIYNFSKCNMHTKEIFMCMTQ